MIRLNRVYIFLFTAFSSLFAEVYIYGAGATFPALLYETWIAKYEEKNEVRLNYEKTGSSMGIDMFLNDQVLFGATDAFLSDEDLTATDKEILHIPTCLGAVVIVYNLHPGPGLLLTGDLLAEIYLGNIRRWNHPEIEKLNRGIKLPNEDIVVLHRSDGSGTSFVYSEYLSKVSSKWRKSIGTGKTVDWPSGIGVRENDGMTNYLMRIPNSIGYLSLSHALENDLPVASIQNRNGEFIYPDPQSISLAADIPLPGDLRISLTNSEGDSVYPIASFTYILIENKSSLYNKDIAYRSLLDFLWWALHDGQQFTKPLHFSPLPRGAVLQSESMMKQAGFPGDK